MTTGLQFGAAEVWWTEAVTPWGSDGEAGVRWRPGSLGYWAASCGSRTEHDQRCTDSAAYHDGSRRWDRRRCRHDDRGRAAFAALSQDTRGAALYDHAAGSSACGCPKVTTYGWCIPVLHALELTLQRRWSGSRIRTSVGAGHGGARWMCCG